uniref:LRRCT domain-containing protein n=1 Tax=Branchiostoma floridae TaxID=7739 RepID=C3YC88_BRAFL|eukprot:XP_002606110.1 hypothetical protein BRAFLDRAFT_88020 [Branchiostoma floridae]
MRRKPRHMLIFLLIILKEPNMPEANCSCAPSSSCRCVNKGLTSIPQNLPTTITELDLKNNLITAVNRSELLSVYIGSNPWNCDCKMVSFRLNITEFPTVKKRNKMLCARPIQLKGQKLEDVDPEEMICEELPTNSTHTVDIQVTSNTCDNGTITSPYHRHSNNTGYPARPADNTTISSDKPDISTSHESAPSFPLATLTGSICGPVVGIVLITFIIWYKRRATSPALGHNANAACSNTNTALSVITSDDDHQYEDIGNLKKKRQDHSRTNMQSLKVGNPTRNEVLAALKPNLMYAGVGTPPKDQTSLAVVSGHNQTGQGQSQAKIQSDSLKVGNLPRDEVLAALKPNLMYAGVGTHSKPDEPTSQTGQGQSQAITKKSNTNTTATDMTGHDDHVYEDIDKQLHQAGKGQSQVNIQSLKVGKPSHNKALAALKPNLMYAGVGTQPKGSICPKNASGHDQTGKGQPQAITESNTNTTATDMTSGHDDHVYEDIDKQLHRAGKGQSQISRSRERNVDGIS